MLALEVYRNSEENGLTNCVCSVGKIFLKVRRPDTFYQEDTSQMKSKLTWFFLKKYNTHENVT